MVPLACHQRNIHHKSDWIACCAGWAEMVAVDHLGHFKENLKSVYKSFVQILYEVIYLTRLRGGIVYLILHI